MSDLISIIVPIYNVEQYLNKCINSILAQTYKNIEVILVDDGSPDKCGEICDEYKKKDNRIKVIHKKNGGLSDARNAGIEIATGEYIGFIDSDDYIKPDMFEVLYSRINKDKSDLAICDFCCVDDNYNILDDNKRTFINEIITADQAIERLRDDEYWRYVIACNKLYKRKLLYKIRFPYGKYHEDEFVAHLIISQCNQISVVSSRLYCYLQRNNGITGSEFCIRNLDGVEAFLLRSEHILAMNKPELAAYIMRMSLPILRKGCDLDHTPELKRRIKELKKKYNSIYVKIFYKNIGIKNFLILTFANMNIYLYNSILKNILKR